MSATMSSRSQLETFLGQASTVFRYLNQGEWWTPKDQKPILVADMTPEHRYNAARFLLRRAAWWADRYGWGMLGLAGGPMAPSGDAACDAFEAALDEHDHRAAMDPQGWMRTMPLFQSLTAGLPGKPQRQWRLYQRARHWPQCAGRRSNAAPCRCTPGARQPQRERGPVTPVLVVPVPVRQPAPHRVVWFDTQTGQPEPAPCRCVIGADHNGSGQPVGRLR